MPGESYLHRLNPVVKMVWLFSTWALAFIVQHPLWNGFILLTIIGMIVGAKIPYHLIKQILKILLPIALVFAGLWPFFFGQGNTIFEFTLPLLQLTIRSTDVGVIWGTVTALRLCILVLATFSIMATTSETEVVAGFLGLRMPYVIAFIFTLVFRFINLVTGDIGTIQEARRARGLPEKQGVIDFVRTAPSLLVPLVLVSVRRIQMVTNAIEVRAFTPGAPRTNYGKAELSWIDGLLIAVISAYIVAAAVARIWFGALVVLPDRL